MKTLLIVDVETGGVDRNVHPLLEIGMALWSVEHRCLVQSLSIPVAAETNDAIAVNGIPPAMVKAFGIERKKAEAIFATRAEKVDAILSYGDFDREWLEPALPTKKPWIDACADLEWPRAGSDRKLISVALAHGVGVASAHRAMADVETTMRLIERVAEINDANPSTHLVVRPGGVYQPWMVGMPINALPVWLARALRPKVLVEVAEKKFDEARNALAKAARFQWDATTKSWRRKVFVEDLKSFPFEVRQVAA